MKKILAIIALFFNVQASAQGMRMTGPIPVTPQSHIFSPAVLPGTAEDRAMRQAGYMQEEYLLSGSANIYTEGEDGTLSVRTANVPYTTRLVLVRPRDPKKFNGVVQLAFTHPSMASAQWGRIDAHILRSGSAYALLVIGGDPGTREHSTPEWPVSTPLLFRWYDPARYAAFAWPDDDGIRWDVMGQTAKLLREQGLGGVKAKRLYMSGWSFLGSVQRSWINFGFHDRYRRVDGGPLIDGYLIGISAGGVNAGHVPLNSVDPIKDRTRQMLREIDSPVIELTSEMEAITNIYPLRAESDAAKGGYRIYELGGTSHGDSGVAGQIRSGAVQLAARRHPAIEPGIGCIVEDSDVPMRDIAQAALVNLDRWVTTGKAPPRASRMAVEATGKSFKRDAFGNPLGGIRAAQLDVSLVHYAAPSSDLCGGKVPNRQLKQLPVDRALLETTYPGGKRDYLKRFGLRLKALVRDGWLMKPDADVQWQVAKRHAESLFAPKSKARAANGALPGGAHWAAEMPERWNGTLLLWSRGYSPKLGSPETAPAGWRNTLLDRGYALAASDYGAAGWSLAEAVPAQSAVVDAFAKEFGRPRRIIGWGQSMGGLVTTALAEKAKPKIDGGIAICPSIGGAVGMMNMALDGSFAFSTLQSPDAGLLLTGIIDDMANGKKAQIEVDKALQTPAGRARLALAGVLGGIPDWTRRDKPRPAANDLNAQVEDIAAAFVMGIFLPRSDQEKRAGLGYSWNNGIDYGRQLDLSGRRAFVAALYAEAKLDLAADLAKLNAAPRISANPKAVDYMMRNYTPSARPSVPLLSVQNIGDGATPPSLQQGYRDAAPPAQFDSLWIDGAGHCGQNAAQALNALRHLEARLDGGQWGNPPNGLMHYTAPPMLRACFKGGTCE